MATEASPLRVGDVAPDFELMDQDGKPFRLSAFRGRKVLLSFHPLAFTGVCAMQMKSLEDNAAVFESLNTVAAGISCDAVPSKKAWADSLGLKKTRILSDFWPHGEVSKSYGLFREKHGTSKRANVIVDGNGRIAFVKVYEISDLPDIQEIIRNLRTGVTTPA